MAYAEVQKQADEAGIDYTKIIENVKNQLKAIDDMIFGDGDSDSKSDKESQAKKKFKTYFEAVTSQLEAQISAIEKEKQAHLDAIDAEIDSLQKLKKEREEYWESQISALEESNKAQEESIKLQEYEEALAKAKQQRVMVFKDGTFQYVTDDNAVASAQENLNKYKEELLYNAKIDALNSAKDAEIKNYEDRLTALEDYKDETEKQYENQINALQEHLNNLKNNYDELEEYYIKHTDKLDKITKGYEEAQKKNYKGMLNDLKDFVGHWNSYLSQMGVGKNFKISAKSTGDNFVGAYASGNNAVEDSELAIVGENPKYRELVIGSKLNNDQGLIMSLKRGSGVVNANATNTLASIF